MPKGFERYEKCGERRVLRLKKNIYGPCQSPRYFWKYLTQKLIASIMLHYNPGLYLFIGDKVLCIVYVGDLIFLANDESDMHDLAMKLCDLGVDLEQQ